MANYKKLSSYDINNTPDPDDLVPSLVDNGDGSYTNQLIPFSALKGEQGDPGDDGSDGQGVPTGGSSGQYLRKSSGTDYDAAWATPTKSEVGLGNVDNTSDVNKPVSTATTTAIQALYPVGSIYMNATNNTNPGSLLGFGTWVAFGAGRVPVGFDSTQTEFDTAEETGGAKTHTLTTAEMPSHDHATQWGIWFPNGTGSLGLNDQTGDAIMVTDNASGGVGYGNTRTLVGNEGGGGAHNNLQPYIVVYMWKRTA